MYARDSLVTGSSSLIQELRLIDSLIDLKRNKLQKQNKTKLMGQQWVKM
jgi:CelD/BcsL family acetyltransferase involved in cellulose biosynthesis